MAETIVRVVIRSVDDQQFYSTFENGMMRRNEEDDTLVRYMDEALWMYSVTKVKTTGSKPLSKKRSYHILI